MLWTDSERGAGPALASIRRASDYVEFCKTGRERYAANQGRQQVRPGVEPEAAKEGANLFPEMALGPRLVPGRLEQRAAQLLRLIHQEGEHHQQSQHHG